MTEGDDDMGRDGGQQRGGYHQDRSEFHNDLKECGKNNEETVKSDALPMRAVSLR
jgi:hypothetical protein